MTVQELPEISRTGMAENELPGLEPVDSSLAPPGPEHFNQQQQGGAAGGSLQVTSVTWTGSSSGGFNTTSSGNGRLTVPSQPDQFNLTAGTVGTAGSNSYGSPGAMSMSPRLSIIARREEKEGKEVFVTPGHEDAKSCSAKMWGCLARVPFGGCATLEQVAGICLIIFAVIVAMVATAITGHTFGAVVDEETRRNPIRLGIVIALWGLFGTILFLLIALCATSRYRWKRGLYQKVREEAAPPAPNAPQRGDIFATGGKWLTDSEGRVLMPRGVNFSGDCKFPVTPDGASYKPEGLKPEWGVRAPVSFVGRPAPLGDQLDLHLTRLRAWGLTFLRLLVTWEAIEHDGPGEYDEEYIAYIVKVVRRCRDFGISVFIDPHQDCWSRWTGGDGAPAWTLDAVGFDLDTLHCSGAAMTHQGHGDPFPKMGWFSNYNRLACSTMFTLFWAGDTFAPNCRAPDGGSMQDWLQRHFVGAIAHLARALKDEPNCIGFETMNEPSPAWVGREADLNVWGLPPVGFMSGPRLTPLEAWATGAGASIEVDSWAEPMRYDRRLIINPHGKCAWKGGPDSCIWLRHGVWEPSETEGAVLLQPDYFRRKADGTKYDFMREFFAPFLTRFRSRILEEVPGTLILVESPIWLELEGEVRAPVDLTAAECQGLVWAPHYYDGITLLTKNFRTWFTFDETHKPVFGRLKTIIDSFSRVVESHRSHADEIGPSGVPSIFGETGIPFDMAGGTHFFGGDWSKVMLAADAVLSALEKRHVPFTWWNYCPSNTNERGDMWNGEDFSVWSRDQQDDVNDLHSGGRALPALVRPYALRLAGTPLSSSFQPFEKRREFHFRFSTASWGGTRESVFFVPQFQYVSKQQLVVDIHGDGEFTLDWDNQTLLYYHDPVNTEHMVSLWWDSAVKPPAYSLSSSSSRELAGQELVSTQPLPSPVPLPTPEAVAPRLSTTPEAVAPRLGTTPVVPPLKILQPEDRRDEPGAPRPFTPEYTEHTDPVRGDPRWHRPSQGGPPVAPDSDSTVSLGGTGPPACPWSISAT